MRANGAITLAVLSVFGVAYAFHSTATTLDPAIDVILPDTGSSGDGTTCVNQSTYTTTAASGSPGCAGFGGFGGTGGQGGGAAIALLCSGPSTTVTVTNGGMFVGGGGQGGSGGAGGAGALGIAGSAGSNLPCSQCNTNTCVSYTLDGGAGGAASTGATGGPGGGGGGGPIYFYAIVADAAVSVSATTIAASMFEGTAGAGGGPNGTSGAQAVSYP